MAQTQIQWTATQRPDGTWVEGYTFNPWIGCAKVNAGCTNCYAEVNRASSGRVIWGLHGTRSRTSDAYWRAPLKWNRDGLSCTCGADRTGPSAEAHDDDCPAGRRQRVFCASLADVFEDWDGPIVDAKGETLWADSRGHKIPDHGPLVPRDRHLTMSDLRRDLFNLIDQTPNLDWLLLTKRPENVRRMWGSVPSTLARSNLESVRERLVHRGNVWLGTSISEQKSADVFVPRLLECRDLCPVLFLSCEPLLGPINLHHWLWEFDPHVSSEMAACLETPTGKIDWVIVGGESGPKARPCDVANIRLLVAQCKIAGVPPFVKQLGSNIECVDIIDAADHFPGDVRLSEAKRPNARVHLHDPKGGDPAEWAHDLRVREFPAKHYTTA